MIRHPSYASRCAQLVLSQSPIFAISLFPPGYVIAHPISPQIQIQTQTAQGKEIRGVDKIPFDTDIELLLVVLILLFATFNFSILRVYYIISIQPWNSPISTSAIFYESIHWSEVTPSYIITTLQSLFERGICSLCHLHVNLSSSIDPESPHSAAGTSMNESDQYRKRHSDDQSTISNHGPHIIPQPRAQFKTFLARTIDRFKCSNKRRESNAISPEMSTKFSSLSMRTPTSANPSINSVATSHSPILSLSPSSGFYSLVEKSPPDTLGQSSLQAYLGPQNPISLRNEISHMESKYSHSRRGSPLETISEEYEGVSTSEHQDTVSEHSSVLSSPISDISRTRDLSFIFFRPESPKNLQTIVVNSLGTSSTTPRYPPEVMLPVKSTLLPWIGSEKITHAQTMTNGSPVSQCSAIFKLTDSDSVEYHTTAEDKFSKETFDSGHHRISPAESGLLVSASTYSSEVSFHSTMTSSRFISNEQLVSNIRGDMMASTLPILLTQLNETQPEKSKEAFHNAALNLSPSSYGRDVCVHVPDSGFAKERPMVESQALKVKELNTDRSDLVSIPSENFV